MSHLRRIVFWRIASDATTLRLAQLFTFVCAIGFLVVAVRAVSRFARTEGEVLLGLLACFAVALQMINMGLILPMSQVKTTDQPPAKL